MMPSEEKVVREMMALGKPAIQARIEKLNSIRCQTPAEETARKIGLLRLEKALSRISRNSSNHRGRLKAAYDLFATIHDMLLLQPDKDRNAEIRAKIIAFTRKPIE